MIRGRGILFFFLRDSLQRPRIWDAGQRWDAGEDAGMLRSVTPRRRVASRWSLRLFFFFFFRFSFIFFCFFSVVVVVVVVVVADVVSFCAACIIITIDIAQSLQSLRRLMRSRNAVLINRPARNDSSR